MFRKSPWSWIPLFWTSFWSLLNFAFAVEPVQANQTMANSLIFLSLFFVNDKEKHWKARVFYPCRTPKILGIERKTLQKARTSLKREKSLLRSHSLYILPSALHEVALPPTAGALSAHVIATGLMPHFAARQNKGVVSLACISCAQGPPQFSKKTLREWRAKWKSFMWVPINSGNRSGSCSENCGFRISQVARWHSENEISYSENGISNSESCSENTPELSESSENGLFTPRAFCLKLGWSQASEHWNRNFPRSYRASSAGPTPLAPTPSEHLIQTWFRPDLGLKRRISGRNQVKIRSESGLGGGCSEGVGARGVGPAEMAL